MPKKRYICSRYPRLKILGGIEFVDGRFDTDNPLVQQRIESNDLFGGMIKCVTLSDVEEAVGGGLAPSLNSPPPNIDFGFEEDDGAWDDLPYVDVTVPAADADTDEGGESPPVLSRSEVYELNRAKLVELAMDLEIEDIADKNMTKLRREVFSKLGV